ncbi:MAG: AAA family ATPase [Desulfobacteraceae bacterium]|nr:AAA family ATPase [Desulfobacteraceae bacterium]MBC2756290.1 AAA family ATPase [Desulfobacteraceae bacterium]
MDNKIVIAAAGSRKTTLVVEEALKATDKKILIVTYTIDNLQQIKNYMIQKNGAIPAHVNIQSWYSFLLSDGVRPYQNFLYDGARIPSIHFQEGRSARYVKKSNVDKYFLTKSRKIYTDKISEFACLCNTKSKGLVMDRLESIYDHIYFDEVQDLSGYDFDFLEILLLSNLCVTIVGDNRQATYFTNCSPKNSRFKGKNIINLFEQWENTGTCNIIEKFECYRCNQMICDFSDKLYPEMSKTKSMNNKRTGHDGVFIVCEDELNDYYERYSPQILRDTVKTKTKGLPALNFGLAKGQNFDRVLIFPNNPIRNYLKKCDVTQLKGVTKAKFYVGLTRARYSVAFFYEDETCFDEIKIYGL